MKKHYWHAFRHEKLFEKQQLPHSQTPSMLGIRCLINPDLIKLSGVVCIGLGCFHIKVHTQPHGSQGAPKIQSFY